MNKMLCFPLRYLWGYDISVPFGMQRKAHVVPLSLLANKMGTPPFPYGRNQDAGNVCASDTTTKDHTRTRVQRAVLLIRATHQNI